jgi:membrane-associated phospholipid phosphatase
MSTTPARLQAESTERTIEAGALALVASKPWLRTSERVLVAYFAYTAVLAACWALPLSIRALAAIIPLSLAALAYAETRYGSKPTGVFREAIIPALVLLAYVEVSWFQTAHSNYALELRWIIWDRLLLDEWHARALIESLGPVIPFTLELSYFLMYAIPPLSLLVLYRCHLRSRIDQFMFTFLLGTLFTYALLPLFPSDAPRFTFPGEDLPRVTTVFRSLNIWVLDHYDNRTSVFPSGHVTAAFSAAFGMFLAFPERKRAGAILLIFAFAIAMNTVYGRYHYLADGIAGFLISIAAAAVTAVVFPARGGTARRVTSR